MPRRESLPSDIAGALQNRPDGATIEELVACLNDLRRFPVLQHSVRSAIYQHLGDRGAGLFIRVSRGRYALRHDQEALASTGPVGG